MKARYFRLVWVAMIFCSGTVYSQSKTWNVDHFDKVILSPHIQATLVEGSEESVKIDYANVSEDKINVEIEGRTLRVYLEGAKTLDGHGKRYDGDYEGTRAFYEGAKVKATITYKNLDVLSVRGEEMVRFESPLDQKEFTLRVYGTAQVYLSEANLDKLKATIYGESYLEIERGAVGYQKFTAYGESKVNTVAIENESTKILAYGESDFRINVTGRLKVTCYGETHVTYVGSPKLDKGIMIGEATVRKMG